MVHKSYFVNQAKSSNEPDITPGAAALRALPLPGNSLEAGCTKDQDPPGVVRVVKPDPMAAFG